MNGSVTEEGSKVASNVIDALKGQPLCLALLLVCVGLVAYQFYKEGHDNENRRILFDGIMKHCVVTPKGG